MTSMVGSSDLLPQPARSPVDGLGAPLFVWGVWAMMLLAALSFVVKYGSNLPVCDEWRYVPYATGEQPVTAELLWQQHNEHRIPLPKILYLALSRLTHCDYRAGMVLNVVALGALAFSMIRVARRLRGSMSYTDAFFPLVLLQLGQYENLLSSFQVVFVTSAILASIFLLIIVLPSYPVGTPKLCPGGNLPSLAAALRGAGFGPRSSLGLVAWLRRASPLGLWQDPMTSGRVS